MRYFVLSLLFLCSCSINTEDDINTFDGNKKNEIVKILTDNGFEESDIEFTKENLTSTLKFKNLNELDAFLKKRKLTRVNERFLRRSIYYPPCDYISEGNHSFNVTRSLIGNFVYLNLFCAFNYHDAGVSKHISLLTFDLSVAGITPGLSVEDTYHEINLYEGLIRFSGHGALVYGITVEGVSLGVIARDHFTYKGYYSPCTQESEFISNDIF
ncbi:hypothetical protein [Ornithobacterium rhinotracheale]